MESAGVLLGLKFFEMGFDDALKDTPLADLRMTFRDTITHEMRLGAKHIMLGAPPQPHHHQPKRRSSVLRSTGRRISDAILYAAACGDATSNMI
jgi:hypothetical protein